MSGLALGAARGILELINQSETTVEALADAMSMPRAKLRRCLAGTVSFSIDEVETALLALHGPDILEFVRIATQAVHTVDMPHGDVEGGSPTDERIDDLSLT